MNVYNTMSPGVADMGMIWMGSQQAGGDMPMGMMGNGETHEMLMENMYYTPSHHSLSNQSVDDGSTMHSSHMDSVENYDMMHFIDMKNESNDSSYMEDENSHQVYMITTATQTIPCPTRKIKPVKHPGLVLKTPIAYQGNTDPSVIPIQKDGIAVCEKCGAIGVKHAFYTRERRFCSMACARGYSGLIPEPLPQTQQETPDSKHHLAKYKFSLKYEDEFQDSYIDSRLPQIMDRPPVPHGDDTAPLVRRKIPEMASSFDWDSSLSDRYFVAAPVTCFKHAPMADIWENVMVGMKVEVENTDCDNASEAFPDSFWVATVIRIVGYKAQLRYEGFGANDSKDFWVSLCSNQVHPVGWCATRGKPLIPPKTIQNKYSDWKDFLRKRLTGARTLPSNYSTKCSDSLRSRFDCGIHLEVVDRNRISQVKLAIVHKIVGKRLNVKYYDMHPEDAGFWCHEDSPLLHPVGWARKVNHHMVAPINYVERINQGIFDEDDATDEMFNPLQIGTPDYITSEFSVGMKLEAIDPLNLSSICAATVMDVLRCGYIMIKIDTYDDDGTGSDWFCYHVKSPCIFPVGFCHKHNIPLTPPKGYYPSTFDWNNYLYQTGQIPADPSLFNTYVPLHGFVPGMKIEAADLMDPRLVCVATIAKVVGRLLKIHFDGWGEDYDQWLDCESSDIYPVGWCHSVGHKLEGPPDQPNAPQLQKSPKVKRKNKKKKSINSPRSTTSSSSHTKLPKQEQYDLEEQPINHTIEHQEHYTQYQNDVEYNNYFANNAEIKSEISEDNQEPEMAQEAEMGESAAEPHHQPVPLERCDVVLPEPALAFPEETPVADSPSNSSTTSESNSSATKIIPRLIDNKDSRIRDELCPEYWSTSDVSEFLRVNDCDKFCGLFIEKEVDGKKLLNLTKEDILDFTGGKVGPSLKMFDLIQQLKLKVNPAQLRHMNLKANLKKFL